MGALTDRDLELIASYKAARVLDNIDGHKLDPKTGLIIVSCGDPDQFPEMYDYKVADILNSGCQKRVTPMSPLGGALRIPMLSPANYATPYYGEYLMFDMKYLFDHKGISTVALYIHAPCAMAREAGNLSFEDIVRIAFTAKSHIKANIPGVRVAVFCHIDYGDGKKKTYFIARQRWIQYHQNSSRASVQESTTSAN